MENNYTSFSYTAVIRTLGKAGEKYQTLLDTLCAQSLPPHKILVFIAEGYDLPKETCGREEYVVCEKGMIHQRSMDFNQVETPWILFCDDDLSFEKDSVERLVKALLKSAENGVESCVISPNTFSNHLASKKTKLKNMLSMVLPTASKKYAFRLRKSGFYTYCNHPASVMPTQTFAGPCCFIKKSSYQKLNFQNERFLDSFHYPLGEDTLFSYKCFLLGFNPLVHYESGIVHLDASSGHVQNPGQMIQMQNASRYCVWYRAVYQVQKNSWNRFIAKLCFHAACSQICTYLLFTGFLKRNLTNFVYFKKGIKMGKNYIKTEEYKKIPIFWGGEK